MVSEERRKELDAELAKLNDEVKAVLAKRKAWMDEHMQDYAEFKPGDEIYNGADGAWLGVVTELYRYWAGSAEHDTSMSIYYRYKTGAGFIDNTSRQIGCWPVSRETLAQYHANMSASLLRSPGALSDAQAEK